MWRLNLTDTDLLIFNRILRTDLNNITNKKPLTLVVKGCDFILTLLSIYLEAALVGRLVLPISRWSFHSPFSCFHITIYLPASSCVSLVP